MNKSTIDLCWEAAFDKGYRAGLEAVAPKWISVNDAEPEMGVDALTIDGYGNIHIACRIDENIYWRKDVDGYLAYFSASYWMPLPEPPEVPHEQPKAHDR